LRFLSAFSVRDGRGFVAAFSRFGRATEVPVFVQSCCIFLKIRDTTSRGLCGLVCPSRTSEGGGKGDCVKKGGGEKGKCERDRALGVRLCPLSLDTAENAVKCPHPSVS